MLIIGINTLNKLTTKHIKVVVMIAVCVHHHLMKLYIWLVQSALATIKLAKQNVCKSFLMSRVSTMLEIVLTDIINQIFE